tara:strand:+ start:140 stop:424 length:285 start_codon:yes stop_codon:yes gene_type:complete
MTETKTIYAVKSTFNSEKSRQQFNKPSTKSSFFSFYNTKESSDIKLNLFSKPSLDENINTILTTKCSYNGCDKQISSIYSTCCKDHNFYVPPQI